LLNPVSSPELATGEEVALTELVSIRSSPIIGW
jgi:hypothetical protein